MSTFWRKNCVIGLGALLLWTALAFGARSAAASVDLAVSVLDLSRGASAVAVVVAVEQSSEWQSKRIVTLTRVRISRFIEGSLGPEVVIRTLGGSVGGSIMFSNTEPGPHARPLLNADDGAAICAAYPESGGRTTLDDQGLPITVEATPCVLAAEPSGTCGPLDVTHGCSVSRPASPGLTPLGVGCAMLLLALLRFRRLTGC